MLNAVTSRVVALALFGLAVVVSGSGFARADDKKPEEKKTEDPKPGFDPKEVRVGPPPELSELRKAVEDAARKGENVDEIRKQLESLEKALAGKAWVKPKPVEEAPARDFPPNFPPPGVRPFPMPQPVPLLGPGFFDPKAQEAMQKAQELMLKAALLRVEDPAKAEELMKQARELMGVRGGGLLLPPGVAIRPAAPRGTGRLGVRVEKVPAAVSDQLELPAGRGVMVAEVVAGSAAEKAGLKANDIIVELAGKPVGDDPTEFVRTVIGMKTGEKVDISYLRKGKKGEAKAVLLADLPDPRRGGLDILPPDLGAELLLPLEPLPVLPLPQLGLPQPPPQVDGLPPLIPDFQKSKSVSVKVQNGSFTIDAEVDGVKFFMEGPVGDTNKAVPAKIEITDGAKKVEAATVEKLPADYRDRVQKILDGVKVGK